MAKQEGEISIVMAPSNNQSSHAAENVHQEANLEKQPSLSSLQPGVYRADVLRKSWTKQGLIIVFTGCVIADILQAEGFTNVGQTVFVYIGYQFRRLFNSGVCPIHYECLQAALCHERSTGGHEHCSYLCLSYYCKAGRCQYSQVFQLFIILLTTMARFSVGLRCSSCPFLCLFWVMPFGQPARISRNT